MALEPTTARVTKAENRFAMRPELAANLARFAGG
jgi:hypothetical protein